MAQSLQLFAGHRPFFPLTRPLLDTCLIETFWYKQTNIIEMSHFITKKPQIKSFSFILSLISGDYFAKAASIKWSFEGRKTSNCCFSLTFACLDWIWRAVFSWELNHFLVTWIMSHKRADKEPVWRVRSLHPSWWEVWDELRGAHCAHSRPLPTHLPGLPPPSLACPPSPPVSLALSFFLFLFFSKSFPVCSTWREVLKRR